MSERKKQQVADVIITVYEKKKAIHTDLLYNRFCKISKKEFTGNEMKRKRTKLLVFFVLAGILALFYMTGESYYEGLYGGSSQYITLLEPLAR